MKRFSEQLQNQASKIHLTTTEQRVLRERVVSYMEYHPLPVALAQKKLRPLANQSEFRLVSLNGWKVAGIAGAFCAVFIVSLTYLAERAVPGDSLYAVKVRFNEEVRSTLAFSPYEKVVWETERLNRRISEARLLASEGKLTEEVEAKVALAVREHSDNAQREIAVLKETDQEEAALASIQLATALDVQSTSLRNTDQAGEGDGHSTNQIAYVLAESENQINELRVETDDLPSFERLSARVERETTRAYELLNSVKAVATNGEKTDTKRRLEDIGRAVLEANKKFETDNLAGRQQLVAVLERTQKLIVFMTNIDVRNTVTVEQIVPVTLTPAERVKKVEVSADRILILSARARESLTASTTALDLVEKLSPALRAAVLEAETVRAALLIPEFDLASLETRIEAAEAITLDAITLLHVSTEVIVEPAISAVTSEATVPVATEAATTSATSTEPTTATSTEIVGDVSISLPVIGVNGGTN